MKSIIFICLGNICRSSLAEGIAKYQAKKLGVDIKIDSAGTSTFHNGEAPCSISQNLAKQNGIDISSQVSQHTSEFDLKSYDLIIAMDERNRQDLLFLGLKNVVKLGFYGFGSADVSDLYYHPNDAKIVYGMVEKAVSLILEEMYV